MFKALTNSTIFTGREIIVGKAVIIDNNRIAAVADPESIPSDTLIIDCESNFLAPGLIDLQIAGSGGYLFSETPTAAALKAITDSIVRTGTTSFLIAVPTNYSDVYSQVIRTARDNPNPALLGLHFEGPYISTQRRGAHLLNCIKAPERFEIEALVNESMGVIRMMTVAPEICTREIIEYLMSNDIVVAAGHSNATYREAVLGFKWGIQTTTHLFNAMSQMHHRDPGLPGATFETENITASIVADGIHVDYSMISIAKKLMKERLFLISDAVEESVQGATMHRRQKDRFTLPDGTLSGSLLTMLTAVRNCVDHAGIPIDEALRMASTYPARVLNLNDKGRIESGFKADLVLFDKNYDVRLVVSGGEIITI
jgi:N-acetylglucosamine-6-phosphate deacetylase